MNKKRYPQIHFDTFIEDLAKGEEINVPEDKREINVCVSGGGMACMYSSGLLAFLYYLEKHNKVKIKHLYGASAGAISCFFYLLFVYKQNIGLNDFNVSKFISDINNILKSKYAKHPYVIDNWMEYIEENISDGFYEYCSNKLFVTIHVIENGFWFVQKTVSVFTSNEHLINILRCSGTIPYVTVPTGSTELYNTEQYAYDGIYPQVVDNTRWTLYVNVIKHNYPLLKRMTICDKSYEPLLIEGVYDIYHFYSGLKPDTENKGVIYYYKNKREKQIDIKNNIEHQLKKRGCLGMGNIINMAVTAVTALIFIIL